MGLYGIGKTTPCKDCTERTIEPNCHSTCERYLDMVERNRVLKEKKEKALVLSGAKNKVYKFQK